MKVSVIIPNWNGEKLLEDCLLSLNKQTFKEFEVILVDNSSTDNSIKKAFNLLPEIRILKLNKNFGFAKAINKGALKSKGEYLIFLNNDTELGEKFIENLVEYANVYKDTISFNPKILNFFERKKIDGLGIDINEVGQARSLGWGETDYGQFENPVYIFGATGGASLFRKKEFLKLGLFDEDYFMYSEEVDFAFRAQFLGFKSMYSPKAICYHKHKATSGKNLGLIEYWQFKNMMMSIIKDFPSDVLFRNNTWLKIIFVFFHTIYYQIKNGYILASLKTFFWLLFNLPILLNKRKKVQETTKVDMKYIESFFTEKNLKILKIPGIKLTI